MSCFAVRFDSFIPVWSVRRENEEASLAVEMIELKTGIFRMADAESHAAELGESALILCRFLNDELARWRT